MTKVRRFALLGAGIVVGGTMVGGLTTAGGAAPNPPPPPPLPVAVTNTPLPVTGTVSLGGTGTVNVGNTVAVQHAPAAPFTASVSDTEAPGPGTSTVSFTVPAGKRLVIEEISVSGLLSAADVGEHRSPAFNVSVETNNVGRTFWLSDLAYHLDQPNAHARWTGTQAIRLYADGGTSVSFTILPPPGTYSGLSASYTVSGYLV